MILSFGEISWDRLHLVDNIPLPGQQTFAKNSLELPGGCALNTAVHLKLMGKDVVLFGNDIADDKDGVSICSILDKIDLKYISNFGNKYGTPRCDILIDKKSRERSFILYHDGLQNFNPDILSEIDFNKITTAFVDTYLKDASETILRNLQDKCHRIWLQDLDNQDPRVEFGDVVQISLNESISENDVRDISRKYFRGRCKTVFATVGRNGAFITRADGLFLHCPSPNIDVIDTTGCGDAFRAAAIASWDNGELWENILFAAVNMGAYQATILGSNPIGTRTR